jgi:tetratricopeptide (TPR) repeat protein
MTTNVKKDGPNGPTRGPVGKRDIQMKPGQAIELAGKLYSNAKFAEAADLTRQILAKRPEAHEAANILAVSIGAMGNRKDAIKILKGLVKKHPEQVSYWSNLGELERQRGNLGEAVVSLRKSLEINERNPQGYSNLGIVEFEMGQYEKAVASYNRAIELAPKFPEVRNNLGNALRMLGRLDEAAASYQQALVIRENYPEAYHNLGVTLRDLGKIPEAEHSFRKAINLRSNYIEAHANLASLLFNQKSSVEALRVLGDGLKADPKNPSLLMLTARIQYSRQSYDLAERAVKLVLSREPENVDALTLLGQIFHETDRYAEAISVLERAVKARPDNAEARNYLGIAYKSVGDLDRARQELLNGLELAPHMFGSYANLNDIINFSERPDLVDNMTKIFDQVTDENKERHLPLYFAYAKALDDINQSEKALEYYIQGAKLKRAQLDYNEGKAFEFFDSIMENFNADLFRNRPFEGLQDDRPVFIVGMPRSGSTLIEQIVSSHPDIYGAGEIKTLPASVHHVRDRFPGVLPFPAGVSKYEPFHFQAIAEKYLEQVAKPSGGKRKITDKLLTNYFFVGMINILYPNARIIHAKRNPVDTCLSAFTKLFKDDMPHSYEFGELGRYYKKYLQLMAHWEKVLPEGVLMTVNYEDVVGDTEAYARKLIDFIGLDFHEDCLKFYESKRPVRTASVAQVRKPVYKTSVERWRKYGPGLQPLLDALDYKG